MDKAGDAVDDAMDEAGDAVNTAMDETGDAVDSAMADGAETVEKIKARPNPNLEFLGVVITIHDKRTILGRDIKNHIKQVFGPKVFRTIISRSVRLEESPAYKEPIFSFAPHSTGALQYYKLSEEVIGRV